MKGLIIKDILFLKNNLKLFVFVIIFALLSFFTNLDSSYMTFIIPMALMMLCISSFSYDEFNKWDAYAISLPIKKNDIVKGKYLFTCGICLIGAILIGVIYTIGLSLVDNSIVIKDQIEQLLGILAGVMLCISFMYPTIYKFGSEKGRMFIFIGAFGIGGLGSLLFSYLKKLNINFLNQNIINIFNNYGIYIFIIVITIFLFLSYFISCKIYNKKEF